MLRRSSGRSREVVACENRTGGPFFFFLFQEEIHSHLTWGTKFLQGVYFCRLAIFCVLRELIFPIRTDWFCLELIFAIFRKYPVPSIDYIFVFIEYYTCNRNTYFQVINQYFVVSEWKRQVVIEQTRFLSTVFLCSEFTLKNIYSAVNICRKMWPVTSICGNLFLWIAGKTAKIAKIRTRKNFLPHGILREEERLLLKISKHGIHSMYFLS